MLRWLKRLNPFTDGEDKVRKRYKSQVDATNHLEAEYQTLTNDDLRNKTESFRLRVTRNETLDDILPEAFAVVREASRRTIGLRHYDVQLIGGIVLHEGTIAEMKTGEGKTLVATLPLYLNALSGKGAHLITVNDYLARRDAGWMGPIYHLLGLSVGFIGHDYSAIFDPEYVDPTGSLDDERLVHWRPCTRKKAYHADITYGTNNEFGFDYLRDNMAPSLDAIVQNGHNYAIVDEVDNILIDEARTPLIISGPAQQSSSQYARFAGLVQGLRAGKVTFEEIKKGAEPDGDVIIDLKSRSVVITEAGLAKVEERITELGENESIYDPQHSDLTHYLENALKAKFIFHRDKDYVVQEGEVIIVDEFTGRMMPGRRWSDGLHQAVEAKENVHVRRENVTYATITFQNYFRLYAKLSGMTGTADTEREEFGKIYNLDVAVIPTNLPCVRADYADYIYRTEQAKFKALTLDIAERASKGQPVLVGTTSVETSERLSTLLNKELKPLMHSSGVRLHVLNAKQNADEAAVVAQAGQRGTVTIATNMAGRGTDILLGGNAEALAARHIQENSFDRKQLEELAESLFGNAKGTQTIPHDVITRSKGKLSPDLIDALQSFHEEYEQAITDMHEKGIYFFLANKVLHHVPAEWYDQKLELVQAVLQNDMRLARSLVQAHDAFTEMHITEIQHIFAEYQQYDTNKRERPKIIAKALFETIYTARARIVQLTLRGDIDAARALTNTIAGLKPTWGDYVDDVVQIQRECKEEYEHIKELGGLYVIGTERHEARRIDNQLRGRAGRQGDPGSSRFYLSLEDELMLRFGHMDKLQKVMQTFNVEEDMPIESAIVSKALEGAQTRVEGYNFDIRKHTVEYDDVMNKQREVIYSRRRMILEEANELVRIRLLLDRSYQPGQLTNELREEMEQTATLTTEIAYERLSRLIPDVSFTVDDVIAWRELSSDERKTHIDALVAAQQHASFPRLVDDLCNYLDMPDNAEETLRQLTFADATKYIDELWRDQRQDDIEENIQTLFVNEITTIVNRYLLQYDTWLSTQINEAVSDAVNPANDEVSIPQVQRRLKTILPEIDTFTPEELILLATKPEQLQRTLAACIPQNREKGHHIDLLAREIKAFLPVFATPKDVIFPGMSYEQRQHTIASFLDIHTHILDTLLQLVEPAEDGEEIKHDSLAFIRETFHTLFQQQNISQTDKEHAYHEILAHIDEVFADILDALGDVALVQETLINILNDRFERWRDILGVEQLHDFQCRLMLAMIDREWQEYLTAMEDLRQGIGLQAIGQRDPLVQYKTAAYGMFQELLDNIDRTVVNLFFSQLPDYHRYLEQYRAEEQARIQAVMANAGQAGIGQRQAKRTQHMPGESAPKIGRNDECPCGSGLKYKDCHGKPPTDTQTKVQRGRTHHTQHAAMSVANSGEATTTNVNATTNADVTIDTASAKPSGRRVPPAAPTAPARQKEKKPHNKKRR